MGSFCPDRANKVKDIMSSGKWTAPIMAPHLQHANHPFFLAEKIFINARKKRNISGTDSLSKNSPNIRKKKWF
jgi:hypothetical protein